LLRAAACQTASPAFVAAGGPQQHPLVDFSQRAHAERLAKPDDRLDDGACIAGASSDITKARSI
jgi:hypothetical protein